MELVSICVCGCFKNVIGYAFPVLRNNKRGTRRGRVRPIGFRVVNSFPAPRLERNFDRQLQNSHEVSGIFGHRTFDEIGKSFTSCGRPLVNYPPIENNPLNVFSRAAKSARLIAVPGSNLGPGRTINCPGPVCRTSAGKASKIPLFIASWT